METHFDKDDMIRLHHLLYQVKVGLEENGLVADLSKYSEFDVFAWRRRANFKSHWHAVSLLANALAAEAVRLMKEEM